MPKFVKGFPGSPIFAVGLRKVSHEPIGIEPGHGLEPVRVEGSTPPSLLEPGFISNHYPSLI